MEDSPDDVAGSYSENVQRINLDEVMDISMADDLKNRLLTALQNKNNVVLEADLVEKADTSALQVLMAFVQDARVQQQSVSWHNPSKSLKRSAGFIGLQDMLGFGN